MFSIQSEMLGERASRWLALSAVETITNAPLSLSETERSSLLTSPDFFKELRPHLKDRSLTYMQNFFLNRVVLPFCERVAPAVVQKTAETALATLLDMAKPETPFPKQLVTERLHGINRYFAVLHSALERAANAPIITDGGIEQAIAKELENAQSCKTQKLYAKILCKGIAFSIDCSKQALLENLDKRASLIRYCGKVVVESAFLGLQATIAPFLWWAGNSWIKDKLKAASKEDLSRWVEMEKLEHPLIAPFIHFARRILEAHVENIKGYGDPSRGPSTGIDRATLKQFLKQQMLLLGMCPPASQDELRKSLQNPYWKQLFDAMQNTSAPDEIAKSIDGMIGIIWETVTQDHLLENEIARLLDDLNAGFVSSHPDKTALVNLKRSIRDMREYLISSRVHTALEKAERTFDKTLAIFPSLPPIKDSLVNRIAGWLGQPIKTAIADRVVPMGMSVSRQAMEKIDNFWTTSYNLRYGILHHQVLLPML